VIDAALRTLVRRRAAERCEYCLLRAEDLPSVTFNLEHIVARQHKGSDHPENLALACDRCNLYKGPNLTAIDPTSRQVVLLFNPRQQQWAEHFQVVDYRIVGLTPVGRATAQLLHMNATTRVQLRKDIEENR
jgi:hypothetical protein